VRPKSIARIEKSRVSAIAVVALLAAGCSQQIGGVSLSGASAHGDVYYLDGAGGGGAVSNWGRGVKTGLKQAGYTGAFVEPRWETGMGVLADQVASEKYKRDKAEEVAESIRKAKKSNPNEPVTLMGLSAGTAVAVFVLEALPEDCTVDNVVLLGASIASDYDLTKALKRVSGRMYVFTSERDAVLNFAVPLAGTADRESGSVASAGLDGFVVPAGASASTRRLYSKVTNIAWRASFEQGGDYGGHTDTTHPKFVRDHIAPIVMQEGPQNVHPNWNRSQSADS